MTSHNGQHGPNCFGCKVRTIQFRTSDPFVPHFNYSVGEYVTSRAHFEDALRRGSDHASQRVGCDHDYQPLYPGDVPRPTLSGDIFETRERVLHDGPSAAPTPPDNPEPISYDRPLPDVFSDLA